MSAGKRLSILSVDEIGYYYNIPELSNEDRVVLFSLTGDDHKEIQKLPEDPIKINYILQLGYFRAKNYFFNFSFRAVQDDVRFIINNYFPQTAFPKKQVSKYHHYDNQKKILRRFKYRTAKVKEQEKIKQHAKKLARRHVYPRFIFDELITFCQQFNIIKPKYSTLQSIVSMGLNSERDRILNKIYTLMNKNTRSILDSLLKNDDSFYQITLLKKDPKDFSTREMRTEVEKQKVLFEAYDSTKLIMPQLDISAQNLEFFGEMAKFYPPYKLKRLKKKNLSRLYLLCYVHQRYFKINDHLATFFSYRVNKYYQEAEACAKEKLIIEDEQAKDRLDKAKQMVLLFSDKRVSNDDLRPNAFKIVPEEKINQFAKDLTADETRKTRFIWEYLESQGRSVKLNIRPVFQTLLFNCDDNEPMKKAVDFLNKKINSRRALKYYPAEEVPLDFASKALQECVIEKFMDAKDKRRRVRMVAANRYEYLVYMHLNKMLDSGHVYINDSINYRRLENDLVPYEYWIENRKEILTQLNLSFLLKPIKNILEDLNKTLTERYQEVNKNIKSGNNLHIRLNKNKNKEITWKLPYRKQDDAVNNPFYMNFQHTNIGDIIRFVIESTGFDKDFKHIQPYYSKTSIDRNNLIAALIANGAGFGIGKMSNISDMNLNELISTNQNFFRLQTLRDANDTVVNQIAQMPIFKFYTLSEYGIHASVDGQKVETKNHTIKARYSKKYFGLGKGVVSMKLVANNVPINDRIIGSNEYEGHYLFDLVYNNSSDIGLYAVSGDMHSINRVNFALMYLFGYRFMPRFTRLQEKAQENLVSFQSPSKWGKFIIKPKNKINVELIIKEWDNVRRILASLAMKETTQAVVIRKLSSYKRNNPTLKALIEFDKIIMSLYMLDYIDDPDMRSNVHRSLNRGEALHQLISAIRRVSDKKLPGKNEIEMEMYNECTRLLSNCIIFYNAALLSNLYKKFNIDGDHELSDLVKRLSPVAWRHINLIGKYEICANQKNVDIQILIRNAASKFGNDFASQMLN